MELAISFALVKNAEVFLFAIAETAACHGSLRLLRSSWEIEDFKSSAISSMTFLPGATYFSMNESLFSK
jgi:hypothetical protein